MSVETLNNFSLISRLFGNLFYRAPTDPVLANVFVWLQQKGLEQIWVLDTDMESKQAMANLQMPIDLPALEKEYHSLFSGEQAKVQRNIAAYGINVEEFIHFRQAQGMPENESAVDFGSVLLTASWIEDNVESVMVQTALFTQFLLPCGSQFLNKVENSATLPFYRSLAILCREILGAMADELEETENE
ncbi:MAG TPA: hypothetical protein DD638_00895 [Pasteurellaceae bacterium]|nr:hypothetical protein [Pasteurellaceae bacterium]